MRHQAILNLYPNVVIVDDAAGAFDAEGNEVALDESAVDTEVARLQAEYDSKAYSRARENAYPKIGDQLDMLWHAIDADTTLKSKYADFHAAIKTVKDDNPKS